MGRTVTYEIPLDTSLFTPLQAQPRMLFWIGMNGWPRWLSAHWVSFRKLLTEQGLGVVVAGLEMEYLRPFTFFDADLLVVTMAVRVRSDGGLFFLEALFAPPGEEPIARGRAILRPVRIGEGLALSATPANLSREILARFSGDEIVSEVPPRVIPKLALELETSGPPLAKASRPFDVHRHDCEVADQWSAIAIPDLAAAVREEIVSACAGQDPTLAAGLANPLRRITIEFRRAAFFLDRGRVDTRAFARGEQLIFLHRFLGSEGEEPNATAIEWF